MTQVRVNELVTAFNELYLTYRKKFILQQADGSYNTVSKPLNDYWLAEHIKRNQTLGIFSGRISKFICFDVDTAEQATRDMRYLYDVLVNDFNINSQSIAVSLSGGKGYHVEIFFKDPIQIDLLKVFYRNVLKRADFTTQEIELRPLFTHGVKLPLSKHKRANRICWYIDPLTLCNHTDSYVFTIEQLDTTQFIREQQLQEQYEIEQEDRTIEEMVEQELDKSFKALLDTLDLTVHAVDHLLNEDLPNMLETGLLKYPHTRNKYTVLLAIYLKDLGYTVSDSIMIIDEIMLKTKRTQQDFIQSSERHIQYETQKIVKHTHKKNYTIHQEVKNVYITRDEVLDIMNLKGVHLQRLYSTMLIHAKRYSKDGKSFYMAYSVMTSMGNSKNITELKGYIENLSDRIEVIQNNIVDSARSKQLGRTIKKPNIYGIKKSFNQNSDQKVLIKADVISVDIQNVIVQAYKNNVISFKELKSNLSRRQFDKFKQSL